MTDLQHALLKNTISKTGIQLLVNDSVHIPVHNTFLNIAATDNTGFNQHFANIDKAIISAIWFSSVRFDQFLFISFFVLTHLFIILFMITIIFYENKCCEVTGC
jgi:hypothetical protein